MKLTNVKNDVMSNQPCCWACTVAPRFFYALDARIKTVEVRVRIPKDMREGDTLLFFMKGSKDEIATVLKTEIVKLSFVADCVFWDFFHDKICISKSELREYLGNHTAAYGIQVERISMIDINRHDIGVVRNPQCFVKINREVEL